MDYSDMPYKALQGTLDKSVARFPATDLQRIPCGYL